MAEIDHFFSEEDAVFIELEGEGFLISFDNEDIAMFDFY